VSNIGKDSAPEDKTEANRVQDLPSDDRRSSKRSNGEVGDGDGGEKATPNRGTATRILHERGFSGKIWLVWNVIFVATILFILTGRLGLNIIPPPVWWLTVGLLVLSCLALTYRITYTEIYPNQ